AARPVSAARSRGTLPRRLADEERPEALEILRGLLRPAHLLHDGRERVQHRPDESDDEVVVVAIETMAGEPYVGREPGHAETLRERAVLGEDTALVIGGEQLKPLCALQRIPHRPFVLRTHELLPRLDQQRVLEVVL